MDISAPGAVIAGWNLDDPTDYEGANPVIQGADDFSNSPVRREGTSFAALAGLAAYYVALYPSLRVKRHTPVNVKQKLNSTSWPRRSRYPNAL